MKHAYVVFDRDAPLFVCASQTQADETIERERERFRARSLIADHHHLYWKLVPYAPRSRSSGVDSVRAQ